MTSTLRWYIVLTFIALLVSAPVGAQHIRCPYGTVPSVFSGSVALLVMNEAGPSLALGTVDECNVIHFAEGLTIDDLKAAIQINQFAIAQRMQFYERLQTEIERPQ